MANSKSKKKTTSKKPSTKKSNTRSQAKTKSSPKTSNRTSAAAANEAQIGFADYFHAFSKTKIFRFIFGVLVFILAISLNLLLSWNNFDKFFIISGIEIVICACIYIFILIAGKKQN
ncbi:MAG: hypothetical protein MJ172_01230 [Clostridia bacterium]|nr:hypothetical protein [Clostridia bacterium]